MRRGTIAVLGGAAMLCGALFGVSPTWAQAAGGPFQQLSAGNQKAVRALHEAQRPDLRPGTRLTLDQIAARKQSGQGWTRIFDSMKSQGLIEARHFGEVVHNFNERHHAHDQTSTAVASAGGRTPAGPGGGGDARDGAGK